MDPQNQLPNERRSKSWLFLLIVPVLILVVIFMMSRGNGKANDLKYSEIVGYFQNGQVEEYELSFNTGKVTILLRDSVRTDINGDGKIDKDDKITYSIASWTLFVNDVGEYVTAANTDTNPNNDVGFDYEPEVKTSWLVSMLPSILLTGAMILVLWLMMRRAMQSMGGDGKMMGGFSKARIKKPSDDKRKVTFGDVAGADEEKAELQEIVDFLKSPKKYKELGARVPKGVLLVGPPGTGKTLLAKAVAGEANAPFYSISGSDFVEMYVGVGASRVRDLFETAKKNPAAIIFIDEIDAVGRHRGAGLGGGHDEREQTLNQLLVEMDGFGGNDGVIVIAATNRPDILDPALLRPGRFDRHITVGYPDMQGREDILKVHAKGKPFEKDVNLREVAQTTVGFTGADLANLLNEAALLAARKGKHLIGKNDIEEATIKIIVGPQKRGKKRSEHDIKLTAYHEAGHAVCTKLLPTQDPVTQISIIQSGRAGGYTLSPPVEDKSYMSKLAMEEEIVSLLGGRVAEQLIFGDISTGASNDIQRATNMARSMVTRYGMSEKLGPIVYGSEHSSDEVFLGRDFNSSRDYSEKTANDIDEEIRRIVENAYDTAVKILTENMDKMHFIAEYLMKNEVMDGAQFRAVMEGNPTFEELDAMVAEKRRISEEENRARAAAEEQARKRDEEEAKRREQEANDAAKHAIDPIDIYTHRMNSSRFDNMMSDQPRQDSSNDNIDQDSDTPKDPDTGSNTEEDNHDGHDDSSNDQ